MSTRPPIPNRPLPPLPTAKIAPPKGPLPPRPDALTPAGLTALFLKNPLHFMRTHAMSPPDGSGWKEDAGTAAVVPSGAATHPLLEKARKPDMGAERRVNAGGIRWVKIEPHNSMDFPGAVMLKVAQPTNASMPDKPSTFNTDGSWLPIYWLPWESLKLMSYKIPEFPAGMAEDDDEHYPRFFFTAGINGCSVFAQGDARSPTITHAGITGASTGGQAAEFWRKQMAKTKSGYGAAKIKGEINADDYSLRSARANALAKNYLDFLGDPGKKEFNLEVQSPFGCVFGIRYGRMWSLYLQRSAVYKRTRFHKLGEVEFKPTMNPNVSRAFLKGTDTYAGERNIEKVTEPRSFGPLKIGKETDSNVYSTTKTFCMPLQVIDFFPKRSFVADLKEVFKGV